MPYEEIAPADLSEALRSAAAQGFDLSCEPPLRARLFRLGSNPQDEPEHVLLLLLHHIAGDGSSLAPLARDLTRVCACRSRPPLRGAGELPAGASALPALPVQYADYTLWQHEVLGEESDPASAIARQLAFWTQTLADLPEAIALPADRPRPRVASYRGGRVPLRLPADLHAKLIALARQNGASLFMVLQAGLAALLSRLGGGHDIPIGSPVAGRGDPALDGLVGFFVNTLVLRTDTSGNPDFNDLVARVRTGNLAAYGHQELPFERLVEVINPARSLSHHPLFQVMLAFQNDARLHLELAGLRTSFEDVPVASAKFDLSFALAEERTADGTPAGINGVLEYAGDLFEEASAAMLAERLTRLLTAAVEDPARAIGSLDILSPAERRTILTDWNDTARDIPDATLPELFARQAARTPDAVALVYEDRTLSYRELDQRANQLAHHLRSLGAAPETIVGVCVERSFDMVIALLAILKAGAAYLPLDPDYPAERLAFMLQDAGAPVLVTQSSLRARLPAHTARIVDLDVDQPTIAHQPASAPRHRIDPRTAAYVIYTSGSTGQPKGICVPQAAVVRLAHDPGYVRVQPGDRIAQAANVSFDATTFEVWGALLNGATLYLLQQNDVLDPKRFADHLSSHKFNVLFLTTALFNQLTQENPALFGSLDALLFGGEAVDVRRVSAVLNAGGPHQLLHVYGPTESTTFATWFPVTEIASDASTIPIGRPLPGYRAYVLDTSLQPVPAGVCW